MRLLPALAAVALLPLHMSAQADCGPFDPHNSDTFAPECLQLETITIFGQVDKARDVAGGASELDAAALQEFETTDIVRALRRVPGVSLQIEDGWALRPNISIRGTPSERSARITMLEDNVLIAPAPYAAPSAYYFPTFGRINGVEVLKGPASITQGPYTVGGAINLQATPIPAERQGYLQGETGSDNTWRLHGWYGDTGERAGFLVETHQWRSDGYQKIDGSNNHTGLEKEDYLARFALYSTPDSDIEQTLELKLQYSSEDSQQSYLGLTDNDFREMSNRRYTASAFDEMHNEHDQVVIKWRIENLAGTGLTVTAYNNNFERAWYKTEGVDYDGSPDPQSFNRTSWSGIMAAVNQGEALGGTSAKDWQALLDGKDSAYGSIQLRNNAREYYSRGVQMVFNHTVTLKSSTHLLQAGLRYHEDEEDRLQRNDTWQQKGGQLVLNETGLEGNAGNRIQNAEAWAAYLYDRIDLGLWTLTPGLRYEDIDLSRTEYDTSSEDPGSREPDNFRYTRHNSVAVWLPGVGAIYQVAESTRFIGGVHKGFSTPGNEPGVDPEESVNYELGIRHDADRFSLEAMFFFNDYENLVGRCTNSSGGHCEPGQAFNGQGVHIPGLEVTMNGAVPGTGAWSLTWQLAYTWMNAEFQSDFKSDFFGEVLKGDPVPYIPQHQLWASLGLDRENWSFNLSGNYVDSVCTQASCGRFEKTEAATIFDLSAHYRINNSWELYAIVENVGDQVYIAGREPYGARANKPRTLLAGARFEF
jgi:Fe(3+) dicitrate transport protein